MRAEYSREWIVMHPQKLEAMCPSCRVRLQRKLADHARRDERDRRQ